MKRPPIIGGLFILNTALSRYAIYVIVSCDFYRELRSLGPPFFLGEFVSMTRSKIALQNIAIFGEHANSETWLALWRDVGTLINNN